ncbi:MAG: hypothetical protein K8S98_12450 [Planctomycetes bacterium]|nr:hypothetical protein [Planctomycetota bacterium]
MDASRLSVKIGNAEFSAEGPESAVNSQYERWLAAVAAQMAAAAVAPPPPPAAPVVAPQNQAQNPAKGADPAAAGGNGAQGAANELLARIFRAHEDGSVSLLARPASVGESILLAIYGYTKLRGQGTVTTVTLMKGLRATGVAVMRIDRELGALEGPEITRAGFKRGTRYGLTNQGIKHAEELMQALLG